MPRGETLAYLAGIVDGDGYFKVSRTYRTSRTVHPYYATTVGVSQLWPGEGVRIFAAAFGGFIEDPRKISIGRWMARCEVRGSKAESAARRLLPFLQLKRNQAILLLEIGRLRPGRARVRDRGAACRDGRGPTSSTTVSWWDRSSREVRSIATLFRGLSTADSGATWMDPETAAKLSRGHHRQ